MFFQKIVSKIRGTEEIDQAALQATRHTPLTEIIDAETYGSGNTSSSTTSCGGNGAPFNTTPQGSGGAVNAPTKLIEVTAMATDALTGAVAFATWWHAVPPAKASPTPQTFPTIGASTQGGYIGVTWPASSSATAIGSTSASGCQGATQPLMMQRRASVPLWQLVDPSYYAAADDDDHPPTGHAPNSSGQQQRGPQEFCRPIRRMEVFAVPTTASGCVRILVATIDQGGDFALTDMCAGTVLLRWTDRQTSAFAFFALPPASRADDGTETIHDNGSHSHFSGAGAVVAIGALDGAINVGSVRVDVEDGPEDGWAAAGADDDDDLGFDDDDDDRSDFCADDSDRDGRRFGPRLRAQWGFVEWDRSVVPADHACSALHDAYAVNGLAFHPVMPDLLVAGHGVPSLSTAIADTQQDSLAVRAPRGPSCQSLTLWSLSGATVQPVATGGKKGAGPLPGPRGPEVVAILDLGGLQWPTTSAVTDRDEIDSDWSIGARKEIISNSIIFAPGPLAGSNASAIATTASSNPSSQAGVPAPPTALGYVVALLQSGHAVGWVVPPASMWTLSSAPPIIPPAFCVSLFPSALPGAMCVPRCMAASLLGEKGRHALVQFVIETATVPPSALAVARGAVAMDANARAADVFRSERKFATVAVNPAAAASETDATTRRASAGLGKSKGKQGGASTAGRSMEDDGASGSIPVVSQTPASIMAIAPLPERLSAVLSEALMTASPVHHDPTRNIISAIPPTEANAAADAIRLDLAPGSAALGVGGAATQRRVQLERLCARHLWDEDAILPRVAVAARGLFAPFAPVRGNHSAYQPLGQFALCLAPSALRRESTDALGGGLRGILSGVYDYDVCVVPFGVAVTPTSPPSNSTAGVASLATATTLVVGDAHCIGGAPNAAPMTWFFHNTRLATLPVAFLGRAKSTFEAAFGSALAGHHGAAKKSTTKLSPTRAPVLSLVSSTSRSTALITAVQMGTQDGSSGTTGSASTLAQQLVGLRAMVWHEASSSAECLPLVSDPACDDLLITELDAFISSEFGPGYALVPSPHGDGRPMIQTLRHSGGKSSAPSVSFLMLIEGGGYSVEGHDAAAAAASTQSGPAARGKAFGKQKRHLVIFNPSALERRVMAASGCEKGTHPTCLGSGCDRPLTDITPIDDGPPGTASSLPYITTFCATPGADGSAMVAYATDYGAFAIALVSFAPGGYPLPDVSHRVLLAPPSPPMHMGSPSKASPLLRPGVPITSIARCHSTASPFGVRAAPLAASSQGTRRPRWLLGLADGRVMLVDPMQQLTAASQSPAPGAAAAAASAASMPATPALPECVVGVAVCAVGGEISPGGPHHAPVATAALPLGGSLCLVRVPDPLVPAKYFACAILSPDGLGAASWLTSPALIHASHGAAVSGGGKKIKTAAVSIEIDGRVIAATGDKGEPADTTDGWVVLDCQPLPIAVSSSVGDKPATTTTTATATTESASAGAAPSIQSDLLVIGIRNAGTMAVECAVAVVRVLALHPTDERKAAVPTLHFATRTMSRSVFLLPPYLRANAAETIIVVDDDCLPAPSATPGFSAARPPPDLHVLLRLLETTATTGGNGGGGLVTASRWHRIRVGVTTSASSSSSRTAISLPRDGGSHYLSSRQPPPFSWRAAFALSGSAAVQRQRDAVTVFGFTPTVCGVGGVFQRAVPPFPAPIRPFVWSQGEEQLDDDHWPFAYDATGCAIEMPSLTAAPHAGTAGDSARVGGTGSSSGGGFFSKIFSHASEGPSTTSRQIIKTTSAERFADVLFWLGTDAARRPPPRFDSERGLPTRTTSTHKTSSGGGIAGFFGSTFGGGASGNSNSNGGGTSNRRDAAAASASSAAASANTTGDAQFDAFLRRVELTVPEAERRELLRRTGGGSGGTTVGTGSLTGRAGRAYAATGDVAAVHGVVSEMQQRLAERGERLQRAQQRSQEMAEAASEFQRLSAELRQKAKWF